MSLDEDTKITLGTALFAVVVIAIGIWLMRERMAYVQSTRTPNETITVKIFKAWPESVTTTSFNGKNVMTSTSHNYFIAVEYKDGNCETFAVDANTYGLVTEGDVCAIDFYYILGRHSLENIRCGAR